MSTDASPQGAAQRPERGRRSLTASEAAALIGVSVATVRGWADDGRLPSYRTEGGHRRFELEDLRAWLTRRGAAPSMGGGRFVRAPRELPPCPLLARELNARTEAIIARALAGFDDGVPAPFGRPSEPALRRSALRFVRVVAAGVESGRPGLAAGQSEVAGLRGGLEQDAGLRVVAELTRLALATVLEAEAARREGVALEPHATQVLLAVIDRVQGAAMSGVEQARGGRPGPRRRAQHP